MVNWPKQRKKEPSLGPTPKMEPNLSLVPFKREKKLSLSLVPNSKPS
jgi:hypothetical protein